MLSGGDINIRSRNWGAKFQSLMPSDTPAKMTASQGHLKVDHLIVASSNDRFELRLGGFLGTQLVKEFSGVQDVNDQAVISSENENLAIGGSVEGRLNLFMRGTAMGNPGGFGVFLGTEAGGGSGIVSLNNEINRIKGLAYVIGKVGVCAYNSSTDLFNGMDISFGVGQYFSDTSDFPEKRNLVFNIEGGVLF